jgi:hypothetical protein
LEDDLSAMPFEPNLRAFQRGVIGLTVADQNFGDDRSFIGAQKNESVRTFRGQTFFPDSSWQI